MLFLELIPNGLQFAFGCFSEDMIDVKISTRQTNWMLLEDVGSPYIILAGTREAGVVCSLSEAAGSWAEFCSVAVLKKAS